MPDPSFYWTLVFTTSSREHLAERNIKADDVAEATFGEHGAVRIRRSGRGKQERWIIIAPLSGGELLTCVFRAAVLRDFEAEGTFTLPPGDLPSEPGQISTNMKLCVSSWMSQPDEIRSYRAWRKSKGRR